MAKEKLEITCKKPKGDDGYKTFSIRIKDSLTNQLDEISAQTGRSRNELIVLFVEYGLNNYEIASES